MATTPVRLAVLVALALASGPAAAQDARPLTVTGLGPGGLRATVTEAFGALEVSVTNPNPEGRAARVTAFYADRPEVRYARDLWVPGGARVSAWLSVGPVPPRGASAAAQSNVTRELKFVLYDRTDGTDRVVLPTTDERERDRVVLYRKRDPRDPVVALVADLTPGVPGEVDPEVPPEVLTLVRVPRAAAGLNELVGTASEGPLPTAPEALAGIDVLVIAGDRLARDPPALAAIRRWLEAGGRVWVLLDRTHPDTVAPLFGDAPGPTVVGRVGLTSLGLHGPGERALQRREFEVPVPHARTVLAPADRVLVLNDGWPAAFVRRVGRGKVLFTALGAAAWWVPRGPNDRSPFQFVPDFPRHGPQAIILAGELYPSPEPDPFPPEALAPLLLDDIGYAVPGRGTAAGVFAAFVLALAGAFAALRRSRRPGLAAWLVPLAALGACGAFVALGAGARRGIPAAAGVAALVEPVPGRDVSVATGVYALYTPESGPAELGTAAGSLLGLDADGLDGLVRTRAETDPGVWRWEGLQLPAGARVGSFRAELPTGRVAAVARFTPDGVAGKLDLGALRGAADPLFSPQSRDPLAVRLAADGTFELNTADALPPGQFVTGAVLTDRQQRRQALYRQLHTGKALQHHEGRDVLFVWADAPDPPIRRAAGARVVGGALVAVPVEFERAGPGADVTVPRGLLPYRRISEGRALPLSPAGTQPIAQRVRFQLPAAVLPLAAARATVFVQARAPFRRVGVGGVRDGRTVPVAEALGRLEPLRVEIADPELLRTDDRGGLLVDLTIGAAEGGDPGTEWKIEALALEVRGRTAARE